MLTNKEIVEELKRFVPSARVLTSPAEIYVYSQDALANEVSKFPPAAVVLVKTTEEVQKLVKFANTNTLPLTPRAAGTNLVGGCIPTEGGIVVDFSKMNKILKITPENFTVRVQSGVVIGDLVEALEKTGLMYPPDPSNLAVSTIGGSIAQNSSGAKSFKYGSTKDYVVSLKVVTASGEVMETGQNTVKSAVGYNLSSLFTGSEGTLGLICEATLKLVPKPETTKVILCYFDRVSQAIEAVNKLLAAHLSLSALELMDKNAIQTVEKFYPCGLLTDKGAALIIEVEGDKTSCLIQQEKIVKLLKQTKAIATEAAKSEKAAAKIWTARRSSFAAAAKLKPDVISEDLVVPRDKMALLVEGIQKISQKYNLTVCTVGHIGDGNVHPQIAVNAKDKAQWRQFEKAKDEIFLLALKLGGGISAEHGIGVAKKKYISKAVDRHALEYMKQIKKLFDPNDIFNRGKIF